LLCGSCPQITDKESDGVLPRLVRVTAKTKHAAKYAPPSRDIDNAQAKAADQCADFVDLTDQHPICMNQASASC